MWSAAASHRLGFCSAPCLLLQPVLLWVQLFSLRPWPTAKSNSFYSTVTLPFVYLFFIFAGKTRIRGMQTCYKLRNILCIKSVYLVSDSASGNGTWCRKHQLKGLVKLIFFQKENMQRTCYNCVITHMRAARSPPEIHLSHAVAASCPRSISTSAVLCQVGLALLHKLPSLNDTDARD